MENLSIIIYLLFLAENIIELSKLLCFILGMLIIVLFFLRIMKSEDFELSSCRYNENEKKEFFEKNIKRIKITAVSFFISLIIFFTLPPKEIIIAMWAVPKIINNEQVQSIGSTGIEIIEKSLKNLLDNLNIEDTKKELSL